MKRVARSPTKYESRPGSAPPPLRAAKVRFGATARRRGSDFIGRVDAIYADYWAALGSFAVCPGWFEMQEDPISTKDQVFYSLTAEPEAGAVLVGENEIEVLDP